MGGLHTPPQPKIEKCPSAILGINPDSISWQGTPALNECSSFNAFFTQTSAQVSSERKLRRDNYESKRVVNVNPFLGIITN